MQPHVYGYGNGYAHVIYIPIKYMTA